MGTKDKILILIVAAWIGAAVYFKTTADRLFDRIDELELEQAKHVQDVNDEFRKDLRTLNLQFIGRGKHLRKAQKDIVANEQLIRDVSDSLSRNIASVQINLDEHSRSTDNKFSEVDSDIKAQEDRFNSFKRRSNRQLGDIDLRLATVEKDVADLNERVPKTEKEKE
ncbi:MAG: hypothetical protein V3U24_02220 [Candidatus Neomarinimicrobiota bacterium]